MDLTSQVHPCRKDILKLRKNPIVEKDYLAKIFLSCTDLHSRKDGIFIVTLFTAILKYVFFPIYNSQVHNINFKITYNIH